MHGKQDLLDGDDIEKGPDASQPKSEKSGGGPRKLLICVIGKCSRTLSDTLIFSSKV